MLLRLLLTAAVAWHASACTGPTVKVETPKPIAIDINMRVDIFQHSDEDAEASGTDATGATAADAEARRRDRMAEVQTLKNSRLIGENHQGLLSIRDRPPGEYGAYVQKTVEAENADRRILMEATAKKDERPLAYVEKNVAALWRERSFAGEWIEVPAEGGGWIWIQKAAEPQPE